MIEAVQYSADDFILLKDLWLILGAVGSVVGGGFVALWRQMLKSHEAADEARKEHMQDLKIFRDRFCRLKEINDDPENMPRSRARPWDATRDH